MGDFLIREININDLNELYFNLLNELSSFDITKMSPMENKLFIILIKMQL